MEQGRPLWPLYVCPVVSIYLSFFLFFFLAYSQRLEIGCLPYFYTWCGLSANLECMSERCWTRLTWNTGCKNYAKNRHLCTTLSGCILATRTCTDNRKKLVKHNMPSTYLYSMVNFGPVTAEIGSGVWGTPANFDSFHVLPSLLQRHSWPEANQTLHDVWPSPGLVHYIYIFGAVAPDGILLGAKFTLRPSLLYYQRYPILAASSSGSQPNFAASYEEWNNTELLQRTPPIFGRAAIMLGIIPHSGFNWFLVNTNRGKRNATTESLPSIYCTNVAEMLINKWCTYYSSRSHVGYHHQTCCSVPKPHWG